MLAAGIGVEFIDAEGARRCELLACSWDVSFEDAVPVRSFRWSPGQRHFPGWWWSATTGEHVGFESWLERDHVMLLDFDPAVVAFSLAAVLAALAGRAAAGRHAPDFFARLADGTGVVIDVRADDRIGPDDAEAFAATARACAAVGWELPAGRAAWIRCWRRMCGGCRATAIRGAGPRAGGPAAGGVRRPGAAAGGRAGRG